MATSGSGGFDKKDHKGGRTVELGVSLATPSTVRACVEIFEQKSQEWEPLIGQEIITSNETIFTNNGKYVTSIKDERARATFKIGDEIYHDGTWYTLIAPEPDIVSRYETSQSDIFIQTVPYKYLDPEDKQVLQTQGDQDKSKTIPVLAGRTIMYEETNEKVYIKVASATDINGQIISDTAHYTQCDLMSTGGTYYGYITGPGDEANIRNIKSVSSKMGFLNLAGMTGLIELNLRDSKYLTKLDLTGLTSLQSIIVSNAKLKDHFTMPATFNNLTGISLTNCDLQGELDLNAGTGATNIVKMDFEDNNLTNIILDKDTDYDALTTFNIRNNLFDYGELVRLFTLDDVNYNRGLTSAPAGTSGVIDISYNPGTEELVKSIHWDRAISAMVTSGSWNLHANYVDSSGNDVTVREG